jgi:hypothetical protein
VKRFSKAPEGFGVISKMGFSRMEMLITCHQSVVMEMDRYASPRQPLFDGGEWKEGAGGDDNLQADFKCMTNEQLGLRARCGD